MRPLSAFQKQCLETVKRALGDLDRQLYDTAIDGRNETYVHAKVSDSQIELWIYDDEAMFSGPSLDMRFEHPDYGSPQDLIADFVSSLVSCIRAQGPTSTTGG